MKINYKNTALSLLDKMDHTQFRIIDDGGETTFDEKMRLANSIINIWPNILPRFKKKVQYMSNTFYKAYERGCHKLGSVLDAEEIDEAGTLMFKPSESETNTIFYSIKTWGKDKTFEMDATIIFFNNHTNTDKPALGIVAQRRPGMQGGGARFYASKKAQEAGMEPMSVIADIFTMVLFMKYCEVETKLVNAGKKDHHVGTKYVNETKSNVEVLDSTWFTTIIKSDSFWVGKETGGFFKLQPYGPNNSQRKLVWITPYEKEGYTRKAKILSQ